MKFLKKYGDVIVPLVLIMLMFIAMLLLVGCYDLRSMWKDCKITQARDFYQEPSLVPDRYVLKGICKVDEFEIR